jgi:hypothetical protein
MLLQPKNINKLLMFVQTCLTFFGHGEEGIPLRGLVFGFPVVIVITGAVPCCDPRQGIWSFLISSNSSWDTNTLVFLLAVKQQKHKRGGDPSIVQTLPCNSLLCSIREVIPDQRSPKWCFVRPSEDFTNFHHVFSATCGITI